MHRPSPSFYQAICELKLAEALLYERSYYYYHLRGATEAASYDRQQAARAFDEALEAEQLAKTIIIVPTADHFRAKKAVT